MKRFILAAVMAVAVLALPTVACAQTSLYADETPVRTSAVLTSSDVLSTTFTIPADAKAVHVYADFTIGSLTNAEFAPAGAMSGNPAAAGYYKSIDAIETVTATGKYHWRVPRENFGAYQYGGIFTKGTGTATSSNALLYVKFER